MISFCPLAFFPPRWKQICIFLPSAVSDDQEKIRDGTRENVKRNFYQTFPETFYQCNASRTEQSIIVRVQ